MYKPQLDDNNIEQKKQNDRKIMNTKIQSKCL